nr:TetR/AcrR family transcriptional regulator [uncultured Cohaesibacter sp.]
MAGVQEAKRLETGRRLLEAAVSLMQEEGLKALQIRAIAAKAGYSVGSVYKHYPDVDALIIAVNSLTLDQIRQRMVEAIRVPGTPLERLKILARSYLHFAVEQPNLWRGLFDHHLPGNASIPEEHRAQNVKLLDLIGQEIAALNPQLGPEMLSVRSRTCFAAVHGMVSFSMEGRFIGLKSEQLEQELDFLVERLALQAG